MNGRETYKGGADGGGGRAKGKTKAGRHSRTPLKNMAAPGHDGKNNNY